MPRQSKQTRPVDSATTAEPQQAEPKAPGEIRGKLGAMVALLRRECGASIAEMMAATGWQAHSVRGAMSVR